MGRTRRRADPELARIAGPRALIGDRFSSGDGIGWIRKAVSFPTSCLSGPERFRQGSPQVSEHRSAAEAHSGP